MRIPDGAEPRRESDDYVIIGHTVGAPAQIAGWIALKSAEGNLELLFPDQLLGLGESSRMYTREGHLEHGGFRFRSLTAMLDNAGSDTAAYRDLVRYWCTQCQLVVWMLERPFACHPVVDTQHCPSVA